MIIDHLFCIILPEDIPESFDSNFLQFFSKYTTMKSGCLGKLSHLRKSDWLLGSFLVLVGQVLPTFG